MDCAIPSFVSHTIWLSTWDSKSKISGNRIPVFSSLLFSQLLKTGHTSFIFEFLAGLDCHRHSIFVDFKSDEAQHALSKCWSFLQCGECWRVKIKRQISEQTRKGTQWLWQLSQAVTVHTQAPTVVSQDGGHWLYPMWAGPGCLYPPEPSTVGVQLLFGKHRADFFIPAPRATHTNQPWPDRQIVLATF